MHRTMLIIRILFLCAFVTSRLYAQIREPELPFIRGLRVYSGNDETNLPIIYRSSRTRGEQKTTLQEYLTIVFDVNETSPPRVQIKFRHCNKNWQVDDLPIVKDDFYSTTRTLLYEQSPTGVKQYTFRYKNTFPGKENPFVRFLYSGNWVFDITKEYDEKTIYASGRFYVVDASVDVHLIVQNNYWKDFIPPIDRVHKLIAEVHVPDTLYADNVSTIDVYQNQRLYEPARVLAWERQPNTRVEGLGMPERRFTFENFIPGNAYRWYDFRNSAQYPGDKPVVKFSGADFTRFRFGIDQPHHFGAAVTSASKSWDDDYMKVKFALTYSCDDSISIFLAGPFNSWDPMPEDQLHWDEKENQYVVWKRLLRGSYDYQYIIGRYDPERGYVVDQDWVTIEGSGWETRNRYWCLVYYDDAAYGGIDRIVGFAEEYSGK